MKPPSCDDPGQKSRKYVAIAMRRAIAAGVKPLRASAILISPEYFFAFSLKRSHFLQNNTIVIIPGPEMAVFISV
jgi:hypothetical protein